MNLHRIHISLDPRAVLHLRLLADEQQMPLVDLIRDVLDQHLLDDVRNRRTQVGAEGAAQRDLRLRAATGGGPRSAMHCGPGSGCPRRPAGTRLSAVWSRPPWAGGWRRPRPPLPTAVHDLIKPESTEGGRRGSVLK